MIVKKRSRTVQVAAARLAQSISKRGGGPWDGRHEDLACALKIEDHNLRVLRWASGGRLP